MSRASNSARRFSKPARLIVENGGFAGSAQTRNSRGWPKADVEPSTQIATRSLGKREDIQHASLVGVLRQIFHRVAEAERDGCVSRIQSAGYDRAGPTAYPGEHCDVLLAVWAFVTYRLADNSGAGLELPKLLSARSVHRFEPSIHGAEEDDVSGRG